MEVSKKLLYKILFLVRARIISRAKQLGKDRLLYGSYWHEKIYKRNHNSNNYFASRPNPGAGVGHQIANWTAGFWYAKVFGLKFAHIPFCSSYVPNDENQWEKFLNLYQGEKTVADLKAEGYRIVRLPLFNGESEDEIRYIQQIIDSYGNKKVIFLAEQDQFYFRQYDVIPDLQKKFYAVHKKEEASSYKDKNFNLAIHVRRGDIVPKMGEDNPNLTMRYQSNSYFINALDNALLLLSESYDNIHIYLFSQGEEENFPEFQKYENFHFCLNMSAKDSFVHMVFADALITSKSSFSYKPALFSQGIKFCPKNFWHGYPENNNWILLDDSGNFINGDLKNGTIKNKKGN